jgi:hypothetical protein
MKMLADVDKRQRAERPKGDHAWIQTLEESIEGRGLAGKPQFKAYRQKGRFV